MRRVIIGCNIKQINAPRHSARFGNLPSHLLLFLPVLVLMRRYMHGRMRVHPLCTHQYGKQSERTAEISISLYNYCYLLRKGDFDK